MKKILVISLLSGFLLISGCANVAYDTTKVAGNTVVGTAKVVTKTAAKTVAGAAKLVTAPFRSSSS